MSWGIYWTICAQVGIVVGAVLFLCLIYVIAEATGSELAKMFERKADYWEDRTKIEREAFEFNKANGPHPIRIKQ
jgi:hypothetical protein